VRLGGGLHPREVRDERRLTGGGVVGGLTDLLEETLETTPVSSLDCA
jgi:hypothetical protein